MPAAPTRRRFKVAYKGNIPDAFTGYMQRGDRSALLRRESLYPSHLTA